MVKYEQRLTLKTLAEADRPREKLIANGQRYLSDAELLALLIGSGSTEETAVQLCQRILGSYGNNFTALGGASIQDLSGFRGMGEAKSLCIIAAMEISRRKSGITEKVKQLITCSEDAYKVLSPVFTGLNHEEFWILILNSGNLVTSRQMVSKGGMASTIADPKIIFKIALEYRAAAIILAHNHPSGSLKASQEDLHVTDKMTSAGKLLDIPVLDHLIFTNTNYMSLADEGMI